MPNSDDEDGTQEVAPTYLDFYSEYLDHFRAHLAGRDGSELLPASHLPPNAFWTAAEKDAFFHALAVHSRLRPDLIAVEVKTKTVPDVCVYLALLEDATREASRSVIYVGKEKKHVDYKVPRKQLPIAVEVTDEWIQREEAMAAALAAADVAYERELVVGPREEEVRTRRSAVRAKKSKGHSDRDRVAEKERRKDFEAWLQAARQIWKVEDMWQSLDQVSLAALDRMLREEEDGHAEADQANALETLPPDSALDGKLDEVPSGQAAPHPADQPTNDISEALIDPQLLEISRAAPAIPPPRTPEPEVTFSSPLPTTPVTDPVEVSQGLSTPFQPTSPLFSVLSHPTTSASRSALALSAPSAIGSGQYDMDEGHEEDVASMSPVSRRRYQKRLYMRRKRAQATGGVVNENTGRLKPGRKPKQRLARRDDTAEVESQEVAESSTTAVDPTVQEPAVEPHATPATEAQGGGEVRHPHVSGMTRPYKRQAQFASIGINAQRLHEEGVGLFHLQSIGKLMQTYNQLHDVPAEVGSEISVDTIKLLHAIIVQFVAEVMERAIVSREQERIAKLQTKVWRMKENQNVSATNVKHALALLGADSFDKRAHFAGLLKKLDLEQEGDGGGEDASGDESDGEAHSNDDQAEPSQLAPEELDGSERPIEEVESSEPALPPLSLLRTVFTPFVNLPTSSTPSGSATYAPDPATYMPWPPSSALFASSEPTPEDELLPETIDEGALVAELLDDENIDKEDRLLEQAEQNALWLRFGENGAPTVVAAATSDPKDASDAVDGRPQAVHADAASQKPVLKRKRKPRGRSKSVGVTTEGAESDRGDGEGEGTGERRVRRKHAKGKGKGTAHLNEDQLRFMEPDPNGRIKSSVYVLDSD
ncbi:hypothetical protein C8Q70DRAFT_919762 [Cubamyces menziesii]|uniref:Uncharacterized protein n=1 Tax=Trametes cubensis TaxID=1111947 RepID=A0AAD7TTH3_9APHY|nr:hypothetical protein C8Q70DRAFT_919762 [Cubamyces menziesii]KAJ8480997.1 hypothetical protein ONZ51_g6287 [Trametes cubensis]